MPSLKDFRSDFARGRTGPGLRSRPDTDAYRAGLLNAENLMVLSDNTLQRRWGTLQGPSINGAARIEGWEYSDDVTTMFILMFEDATLTIYDADLNVVDTFLSMPWDSESLWFLSLAFERNRLVIADQTIQTQMVTLDLDAGTFSVDAFEFSKINRERRLAAPFYQFCAPDVLFTPTIFTNGNLGANYQAPLATALGISSSDFNIEFGTGKLTASEDFFLTEHVGTRLRLGDGEVEITAVTDAQNADITVYRDLGQRLDPNPFFVRATAQQMEVAAQNHGLAVGDEVVFYGLIDDANDRARTILHKAIPFDNKSPPGTPGPYTVFRVIDENHFEIHPGASFTGGAEGLYGGTDVYMLPKAGFRGALEPAFSDARGWPQACAIHERRLWLAGTEILPDAAWASQFVDFTNFDPGDGAVTDGIALYGIGEQSRIRHLISDFDLQIFANNGEFYVPGSHDFAVSQENVRVVDATAYGCSFTQPQKFDGSTFFVDTVGIAIREMNAETRDDDYNSPSVSVTIPDWISLPYDSSVFEGARTEATPYLIWCGEDGKLVVCHSSRANGAFGFMRWSLDNGNFVSCAGVGRRLFAVAERGGVHYLVRFDTASDVAITTDFSVALDVAPSQQTVWDLGFGHANRTVQVETDLRYWGEFVANGSGQITLPEAVTHINAGDPMSGSGEMNAPIAGSGQGPHIGKTQRLVDAEVHWRNCTTGIVMDEPIHHDDDLPADAPPNAIDEWREYGVGTWGRAPTLTFSFNEPGTFGVEAVVLNVYF